jgi:predicted nucleic acid-binding protein
MSIISNTTVISNFASIGQLELLHVLFDKLYITSQVFDEIQFGLLQGYTYYDKLNGLIHPFSENGWLCLTALTTTSELQTFGMLLENLHSGEASSISIALTRKWAFLSDDKAARHVAKKLGITFSGTLGILLTLSKKNYLTIDQADYLLYQMIQGGYYSPVKSLADIIKINT